MVQENSVVCVSQVQLQNILMSKYVEYFMVEVSGWQRKLVVADLVIGTWLAVQRTWAHLQSIFTNSEDIRNQLAHDAEVSGHSLGLPGIVTEKMQGDKYLPGR